MTTRRFAGPAPPWPCRSRRRPCPSGRRRAYPSTRPHSSMHQHCRSKASPHSRKQPARRAGHSSLPLLPTGKRNKAGAPPWPCRSRRRPCPSCHLTGPGLPYPSAERHALTRACPKAAVTMRRSCGTRTSLALPQPTPTLPFRSPTMTMARKRMILPPLTTCRYII